MNKNEFELIDKCAIGKHLREARRRKRMKQGQVAEKLGMQAASYGNYERGTELPSLTRLIQCCVILDITPGEVLNDCAVPLLRREGAACAEVDPALMELVTLLNGCSSETVHCVCEGMKALMRERSGT